MTPIEVADAVDQLVAGLPREVDRANARQIIRRRLAHPERGANPDAFYTPPPPSTGDCAANRTGQMCARCGSPRRSHNLDGERWDCDGFILAP